MNVWLIGMHLPSPFNYLGFKGLRLLRNKDMEKWDSNLYVTILFYNIYTNQSYFI